tara:strand:+ start:413 stop:646 length:234 start_codon:yes stop_codon:yes gene_type:complete
MKKKKKIRKNKRKKEILNNKNKFFRGGLIYWIVILCIGALLFNYWELGWLIFLGILVFHLIWTTFLDVKYNRIYPSD